jgi:hypothetical protein
MDGELVEVVAIGPSFSCFSRTMCGVLYSKINTAFLLQLHDHHSVSACGWFYLHMMQFVC